MRLVRGWIRAHRGSDLGSGRAQHREAQIRGRVEVHVLGARDGAALGAERAPPGVEFDVEFPPGPADQLERMGVFVLSARGARMALGGRRQPGTDPRRHGSSMASVMTLSDSDSDAIATA